LSVYWPWTTSKDDNYNSLKNMTSILNERNLPASPTTQCSILSRLQGSNIGGNPLKRGIYDTALTHSTPCLCAAKDHTSWHRKMTPGYGRVATMLLGHNGSPARPCCRMCLSNWLHSSDPDVLEWIDAAGFVHAVHGLGISMYSECVV
jgi:hypothetical protein